MSNAIRMSLLHYLFLRIKVSRWVLSTVETPCNVPLFSVQFQPSQASYLSVIGLWFKIFLSLVVTSTAP
jgi:hypothetical protein